MGEPRSQKQQREHLVCSLRAAGKSRVEVAEALRQRYRVNARVALRYAHGWSQRQAADEWNQRWPDEPKTSKSFSRWEQWPSSTGHAPTFDNLGKLAELYECAVSDLLVDLSDFRHGDTASSTQTTALAIPEPGAELVVPTLVLSASSWVDAQTIEHIEAVLWRCRHQDHALGPQAVLTTVLALRDLVRALVPDCPAVLQPRMLSALSEASRQAGWLSFGLQQSDHAKYYYEDARALAHEAKNTRLAVLVLCEMSLLATWQGRPWIGIDHAIAARYWADQTSDMRLRAYAADVAARAYAADGQRDACLTALDAAHAVLTTAEGPQPELYHV